ncbi:succinate dehydrogenase, cytochrome b556 subunit [Allomyces macrogynus ATCC 38327]|uniref:Succinate dehydrogenase, cytochrome b556 subunit n=1 Tax=Allomyces macrogynus (strain ATCC 38327) TaxID=578462 RepID=A0A0L0T9W1_ALLM3|nr:succinate dehydrogenase, cytochrome b556 subunit [Allomyces macrogynus ATCC 38327]|eukprot:KNE71354.1 succinate dehydrogenase, cytochrome b556 subunit [Allomyces macrogynus ATCC 38327]
MTVVAARHSSSGSQPQDVLQAAAELKKLRPMSPHLTIFAKWLTSSMSITHRFTGAGLSALFYGAGIAAAAGAGSADLVTAVAALPAPIFYAGKLAIAAPFAYHTANGIRHLAWDSGRFLTIDAVYKTGYVTLGATAVGTLALLMI